MSTSRPQPPEELSLSIPPSAAEALLTTFIRFLTVATHTILYNRGLYPPTTFLHTRAYNLPVHQSRHPTVCAWINDALAAVRAQLVLGAVSRVALVVHAPSSAAVVERWVFDLARFPAWGPACRELRSEVELGADDDDDDDDEDEDEVEDDNDDDDDGGDDDDDDDDEEREDDELEEEVVWADVDEALRGALKRIGGRAEGMKKLDEGSRFTIAVELRDDAPAPIVVSPNHTPKFKMAVSILKTKQHPQPWIPTEPKPKPASRSKRKRRKGVGGVTTQSIRTVVAGPLWFECWVEEGYVPKVQKPPKVPNPPGAVPSASRSLTRSQSQNQSTPRKVQIQL